MNSPFANIYLALQQRILTITAGSPAAPVIPFIDIDYGQLETPERPSVDFPCAIVDFDNWTFSNNGSLVQIAEGLVCIKLAVDPYSETSNLTPQIWKEAGINILDVEWLLYKCLQGWKPPVEYDNAIPTPNITREATPFIRANLRSDNRRPGLKVRHLYFSTSFMDYSAQRKYGTAPATPNITEQLVFPAP